MSYILDALKKSDQQRQRGATPTLQSVPPPVAMREKSSTWRYGVLTIVLIGAGTLIGWLRPWQQEAQGPVAKAVINEPSTAIQTAPAVPTTSAVPLASTPSGLPTQAALSQTPAMPRPQIETPRAPSLAMPRIVPKVALAPVVNKPVPAAQPAETAADQGRVIPMEELPLGIRQELPELTISMHAYSPNPEKRLVSINNKLLHEGGSPGSGVKLEKITPDGMILTFKGYRFSLGVQ